MNVLSRLFAPVGRRSEVTGKYPFIRATRMDRNGKAQDVAPFKLADVDPNRSARQIKKYRNKTIENTK